jgi:hypothetical protein
MVQLLILLISKSLAGKTENGSEAYNFMKYSESCHPECAEKRYGTWLSFRGEAV